jgi:hypothetical protein
VTLPTIGVVFKAEFPKWESSKIKPEEVASFSSPKTDPSTSQLSPAIHHKNSWRTQRRINRLCAGITRPFTFARPQSQQAVFRRRCDDPARTRRARWSIGVPAGRRSPHAAPDHLSAAWMRALHSALFRPGDGAVGFAGSLRIAVVYGKEWLHPYAVLVKYLLRVRRRFQLHRPQSKAAEAP